MFVITSVNLLYIVKKNKATLLIFIVIYILILINIVPSYVIGQK